MRWKKTTSELKAKVISKKIENPDLSLRDISEKTNLNYQTVSDIMKKEMPKILTSSDKTRDLLNVNLSIIEEGKRIIQEEIKKIWRWEWKVKINSLNDIKTLSSTLEDAFKQNQLLSQKPTEIVNINDLKNISTEELLKMKNQNN